MKFAKEIMHHIKEHKYFLMFLSAYLGVGFYFAYRLFQLIAQIGKSVLDIHGNNPNYVLIIFTGCVLKNFV